jgi:hypothetical protein
MAPVSGFVGFTVKEVQGVPDILRPEGVAQREIVLEEDVFFTNHKNDLEVTELSDDGIVVEEGDVLARHIEIDVLVPVPVEEVFEMLDGDSEVEATAKADDLVKEVGEFEGEVDGVPGAEAAARGDDGRVGVLQLDEGKNFSQYIFLILKVAEDAIGRVEVFGVEAFFIDAVEAVDLDLAGYDLPAEGFDDLPVFVVIEAGSAGRKEKDGVAGVAEYEEFHVPLEARTEPSVVFPVHGLMVERYCRMIPFHSAYPFSLM